MKRFFERLPTVWKYDSTFRILVYLLGAAWFLSLIRIFYNLYSTMHNQIDKGKCNVILSN